MEPPRKGTIAAKKYKSIIHARPFRIENDSHKMSSKSHYCFAQVKIMEELFACYPEEGLLMDCDNMNKIKMNGTTAVSRYHQPKSFFMNTDTLH